ncbi:apical sushi protein, putative [Plasmodium chabaudi chabaudi]|uniref:Apical sushi protein, putative n=1 Tax=Plasmodium chabaudi chabaudi TaxID=31271 RepID=A0A1D3LE20_PLACU|nr:apical sushi protein, putative [Plasmodium chabaudi chabaudi]
MNIIYNVIAYILCYKILVEGKEANGVSFLNIINKSDSIINDQRFEPLDLTKNRAGTGVIEFSNANKTDEDDDHSFRRSKLSFIQNEINKNVEPSNKDKNEKDKSVDSKKNAETFHSEKSKITNEEIIKNGEDFYINEGVTEYGYNNDEEFYNSFHVNTNNKPVNINSLCFGLTDSDSCQQNSNCFYDDIYKTCFQKCSLLNERDCLKYSECKYENGTCENHGFLSIKVFDNDFGADMRSCELFESEESCYLMETRYKKSDNNNRTNFNCVWLTYEQEIKKNKKNENGNMEKINTNGTISQNVEMEKQNDKNMNYILRTNNPVSIAKDEKFISLLETKLNNKKKKGNNVNKGNKNVGKKNVGKKNVGKKNDDDDDNDDIDDMDDESDIDLDELDDDDFKDDDDDDDDIENNKTNEPYGDKNGISKNMKKSTSSVTITGSQNNIQMDKKNTEGNINEVNKNIGNTNKFEKNESLNYSNNNNSNNESKLKENVNIQNTVEKKNGINGSFSELAENSVEISAEPIDNEGKINNININEDNKYDLNSDTHISIEKEVIQHDFHDSLNKKNTSNSQNNNEYDDVVTIETKICINLNTKPSPSILLEGALLAESEAELRKIEKKYNLSEEEICVKPPKETHIIYNPSKEYYIVGEKIEVTCQKGYKISSKTNNVLCIGGNKIMPNIICESENNNEYHGENKYKLKNDPNSGINYSFSILVGIIILVFTGLYSI